MAVFGVRPEDSDDEITCFQAARYISTNEAIWRMCAFPIHCHKPAVQKLQVHLENGQRVCFDSANAEDVAEEPPETTLTAFFSLCSTDDFARTLLYVDVPKYFTFAKKKWRRRLRGDPVADHDDIRQSDCLGRVYTVHPNNTECYHLRLLLHIVKGPTSFAHLRTVDGVVCISYKDACKRRGLLENDDHWHSALAEASLSQMPRCLRDMFAVMIHMCSVSDPLALWDAHKEALSEDFLYRRRRLTSQNDLPYSDIIFNEALICIEDKILSFPSGKHLPEYGIPAPDRTRDTLSSDTPREILAEQSYDQTEMTHIVESRTPSLTPDQSDVYRTICQLADSQQPDNRQGHLIFLDAPGGTGKTYLLNSILAKFRSRGDIALAVASSGIAATLLQGGKTAHSTFKLSLDLATNEYPSCDISRGSAKAQLLARAKIIVWDECTMSHRGAFEALDCTLRDIRQNDTIMGGIILLLAGDFRQILPVIQRGTRLDQVRASLKSSRTLWPHVRIMNLHTNMRLRIDNDDDARQYSELLLRIGNGLIPPDDQNLIQVPCGHPVHSSEQHQDAVFPDLARNYTDTTWLSNRAILAPTNEVVADINDSLIQQLPTNAKEYLSIDTPADIDAAILYPVELLNSLLPSGLPPHRLYLKEGAPIILLRNLDAPRLCNGTKLIITRLRRNVIEANIAMGQYKNESVFIPRLQSSP